MKSQTCFCETCTSFAYVISLVEEKALVEIVVPSRSQKEPFQNIDYDKLRRGQIFFRENYFSLMVSHLVGLICIQKVESVAEVLKVTGKSLNPKISFNRYFSTLLHVQTWCDKDWENSSEKCKASLVEVNCKHRAGNRLAKTELGHPIYQRDMILTQWSFVAPVLLNPKKFGIKESDGNQLQDFLYLWNVIGSHLGIEDRFNLCIGDVDEVRQKYLVILHQIIRPSFKSDSELSNAFVRDLLSGLKELLFMLEPESFLQFTSHIILDEVFPENKQKWQYKWNVWVLEEGFNTPGTERILRPFLNALLRLAIIKAKTSHGRQRDPKLNVNLKFLSLFKKFHRIEHENMPNC